MLRKIYLGAFCALIAVAAALAQLDSARSAQLSAAQIIESFQLAFYYQGNDMKSRITMELIAPGGGKRTRILTMLRRDESEGGNQKYFMYFHEPDDVRGMAFMTWKYPAREDDRWIFVPAVDLVRQIAADDKYSSFVGSDFSYEDVSGRDVAEDTHTLVREENLSGRSCYVVASVPKSAGGWSKRVSWIDKENFLPLKEEYYDPQGALYRVFTADQVDEIASGQGTAGKGYATITKRTMSNIKTGHKTEVSFTAVTYDLGLKDGDFSERQLRNPPREWIK